MPVLFRREVPVQHVLSVTARQARALQAPIRLEILTLLSTRPMSIEELADELVDHGFRKAPNTLRHHVELLRKAGLVDLALLEQSRGAVLKYYASTARVLHHEIPDEAAAEVDALAKKLLPGVRAALGTLTRADIAHIRRIAEKIRPCRRCPVDHFVEAVLLGLVHRTCIELVREPSGDGFPATLGLSRTRRGLPPAAEPV